MNSLENSKYGVDKYIKVKNIFPLIATVWKDKL